MENLQKLYDDINRWLTFAEAKHVAIVTFVSFILSTFGEHLKLFKQVPGWIKWIFLCSNILIIIVAVGSFTPFLNCNSLCREASYKYFCERHKGNVLFYGAIFCMSEEGVYEEKMKKVLGKESFSRIEQELVNQIKDVSGVACVKYFLFLVEMKILIIAFGAFVLMMLRR